jgi:DedD protein
MDQGLKERLVGAAVLIAIAVWLIPWVLDGPEAPLESSSGSLQLPVAEEPMPMRTQRLRLGDPPPAEEPAGLSTDASPAAPTAAAAAEPADSPRDDAAPSTTDSSTQAPVVASALPEPERRSTPADPAPAAATPPKPALAAATGDWTVQLGSFSDEANARRVAQRSGTYGYKADVSSYRSGGGRTLYRVRVGPMGTRAEAAATASALKAHGINDATVVAAR